jgi:hypothetical protein
MFQRKHQNVTLGIVATALSLLLGGSAVAQGIEVVVTGGDLGFAAVPQVANFAPVTVSTVDTTTATTLDAFAIRDTRGTGAGWRVQAQALPLTNADATQALPLGSLIMSRPAVVADGTASPAPTVDIPAGGTAFDTTSPITVATAAANTGLGTYDFGSTTLILTIPAAAYAAEYHSTVTISLVSGPA